ncbi:hypothetical protein Ab1vBOLIVR2_gp67 [Agrobacterium phage OLIVR2]|uniref:Uncharacterized protein n=1 Tax=Agrobacterium phage OLIVR1 TaxID=2723769 RepID=A0A858MR60_9CAUD|nr:hypothetical protein [Xanthomonas campestris]YP_010107101.1 hypothetical protein KNU98_gp042 [Agrobacterium phage OLIVR1]QIW87370.1 hypothetical protein Ab1vBOLIVR2_gp67 [Agrobacterium phage OLIVR2]QIW87477.1 hypothetical protein Ab1vBOLIVR3_gp67 [Agrobacterium phage OLIVR3]MCF8861649.1 hypothetical protein [Xanthomonas campestris pv. campestris]QIW87262.1 hypothetical protein Ab1vBOLIVR1_gp67 [Agrobacterium phage OLIVR1]
MTQLHRLGAYRKKMVRHLNHAEMAYKKATTDAEKVQILDELMRLKANADKEQTDATPPRN